MWGAIAGDIIGSPYEACPIKRTDFPLFGPASRFTDDSVLTAATAEAILTGKDYGEAYRAWYRRHPGRGYGPGFARWAEAGRSGPYGSLGNGSAMRVAPVGWAFDSLERVLAEAERSARPTHDHPEGIRGAQAVASAVFLARTGADKAAIRSFVASAFGYRMGRTVEQIRPGYRFDATCPGSVPEALIAFLDSTDWEDAVRKAVSLGGDSDTLACIAGAVAEAHYGGVPAWIRRQAASLLTPDLLAVVDRFGLVYRVPVR